MGSYNENLIELNKLLGKKFMNVNSTAQHPIRQSLNRVIAFHQDGHYVNRDYENASLSLLVKHLTEVRNHNKRLFKDFRRVLQTCNDDTYFGFRLEISVAASLLRASIPFKKTERPDFTLTNAFTGVAIECGSAHLSAPKSRSTDLKYKIGAVISEKAKHDYCNTSTGLFIDFTNINYHSTLNKVLLGMNELKTHIHNLLQHANFGSVILWTHIINEDIHRYQWKYTREDCTKPNQTLLKFLNRVYPFGNDVTHSYGFPKRG